MKLSQTTKSSIAQQLTEKYFSVKKIQDIRIRLYLEAHKVAYLQVMPDRIKEVQKDFPEYFKVGNEIAMIQEGRDYNTTRYGDGIIRISRWIADNDTITPLQVLVTPTHDSFLYIPYTKSVYKIYEELSKAKELREKLFSDVKAVISSCNTSKQLLSVLPEAEPFLPSEARTAIVPIQAYERLKHTLNTLASEDEKGNNAP